MHTKLIILLVRDFGQMAEHRTNGGTIFGSFAQYNRVLYFQ